MQLSGYVLTDTDVATLWNLGHSPLSGSTLTYARTSTYTKGICYDTCVCPVNGVGVTCFGNNQVPYAYHSALCGLAGNERACLGEPRTDTWVNRTENSEAIGAGWTLNGVTATTDAAIAPDGTKVADTVVETVDNTWHGARETSGEAVAQNTYSSAKVYVKKNTNTTWVSWQIRNQATGGRAYVNVNLDTLAMGNTGAAGAADYDTITARVRGSVGGWIEIDLVGRCINAAGCTSGVRLMLMRADSVGGEPTYVGDVTYSAYWSMAQRVDGVNYNYFMEGYCPTDGSTQTCNAPTSNYVAAANLATWDRSTGLVVTAAYPLSTSGYAFGIHNGVNFNGAVRQLLPATEGYLYNDSAVLQQRCSLANSQVGVVTGTLMEWNSGATIDGTRRVYGQNMSASYAGKWTTYTTDTGANWTPAAGTNLYIGSDNTGANGINGLTSGVWIYKP
jgi:hypothetical protein